MTASIARRLIALLATLCLVLLTTSCSDDDKDPESEPSDSTSASPTAPSTSASPVDTEPTEPPAPEGMAEDSKQGAELLVRYYWQLVDYAQLTGDVKAMKTLSRPGCEACNNGLSALRGIHKAGGFIRGGKHAVRALKVTRLGSVDSGAYRVDLILSSSRQKARASAEAKLDTVPASVDGFLFAISKDTDGRLKIDFWELKEPA